MWSSKTPHKPSHYPSDGLDHNYCRNPSKSSVGLWCYTTDPGKRWEACHEPPPCKVDKACMVQWDTKLIHWTGRSPIYQRTKSGRECQMWSSKTPHKPSHWPSDGLDHNYCRNPSKSSVGLWCYTTDPGKRWEACHEPPPCKDVVATPEPPSIKPGNQNGGYEGNGGVPTTKSCRGSKLDCHFLPTKNEGGEFTVKNYNDCFKKCCTDPKCKSFDFGSKWGNGINCGIQYITRKAQKLVPAEKCQWSYTELI